MRKLKLLIPKPSLVLLSHSRSNLVGTRFTVFNSGVNPKKGGVMSDGSNIREEVAAIIYVSTVYW